MGSLNALARHLVKSRDVVVKYHSGPPMCNLKTGEIFLPIGYDIMNDREKRMVRGMVDHECAHMEQERLHSPPYSYYTTSDKVYNFLLNTLEDLRINKWAMATWKGAAKNINAVYVENSKVVGEMPPPNALALLAWCEINAIPARDSAAKLVVEWHDKHADAFRRAYNAANPTEIDEIATALAKDYAEVFGPYLVGGKSDEEECDEESFTVEVPQGRRPGGFEYTVSAEAMCEDVHLREPYAETLHSQRLYAYGQDRASVIVGGIRRKLSSMTGSRFRLTDSGDEIDSTMMVDILLGEENVFIREEKRREMSTAVSIWLDLSGSMRSRIDSGRKAVAALSAALDSLKVPHEIHGWTTLHKTLGKDATRLSPQVHIEIKSWNDTHWEGVQRLAGVKPMEENDDIPPLLEGARSLLERPEGNKVLFIFSDGQPSHMGIYDKREWGREQYAHYMKLVEAAGIQPALLGIMSDHVSDLCKRHRVCESLEELPRLTLELMDEALEAAQKRDARGGQ